jgi:hypothetical protein
LRIAITLLAGIALLASCGPQSLALPDNPVDKAATCGVVETASARLAANSPRGDLPFDEQGRILHYGMLAASEGGSFSQATAAAVVKRMPELASAITSANFETLIKPCRKAYPATAKATADRLPSDPFEARLGCYELASFLNRSLQSQSQTHPDRLAEYSALRLRLDAAVGAALRQRGATTKTAQDALRAKAMAQIVTLGAPMAVMNACLARYPDPSRKGRG